MTGVAFASLVRYYTKTNSTTFPDATLALLANAELFDLVADAERSNEQVFGAVAIDDLRANVREYPFPSDILTKLVKVEAKLDGTTFLPLTEFDLNSYKRTTDEMTIVGNFANVSGSAMYDLYRNSIWIYSGTITNVTGGLKVWYSQAPTELDAGRLASSADLSVAPSSTTTGVPKNLHRVWALRTSIAFKTSKERPLPLTQEEQNIEFQQARAIDSLRGVNLDRTIIATMPYNDGSLY